MRREIRRLRPAAIEAEWEVAAILDEARQILDSYREHTVRVVSEAIVGSVSGETVSSGVVTFSSTGKSIAISFEDFAERLDAMHSGAKSATLTLAEAIRGLIRERDFLCLQLDHAWGNLSDSEFEEQSAPYLERASPAPSDIVSKVWHVITALGEPVDAQTLASMFQCRIDDVENALVAAAGEATRPQ